MHYLLTDGSADINTKGNDKKRTFRGIANSGKPFVYQGVRTIADLSELVFDDKVPMLLLHNRDKRVGVGTLAVKDNQLVITGTLLDNEHANTLVSEADAGFPFQLSAHIIAGHKEHLAHGQSTQVNGQTVTGEVTILRNCRISEVSFTPTGVDNHTMAVILSEHLAHHPNKDNTMKTQTPNPLTTDNPKIDHDKDDDTTLLAKIKQLTQIIKDKDKHIAALQQQQQKNAHKSALDTKLSQAGFVKDHQDDTRYQGLSQATYELLLSADIGQLDEVIGDFAPKKQTMPSYLLGAVYSEKDDHRQDNPLLDNAKQR